MPEGRVGRVAKISPSIERTTRTFIVEVEVPNEDGKCKPGSFAKASIQVGISEKAATVPLSALYSLAGINKIFLVQGDHVREIQVTLGEQTSEWVEIASPSIPSDSRVVTSGQRMLSDGAPVIERKLGQASAPESSKVDAFKNSPTGTSEVTE
jgi:multidrug efflux pump subunit AcrA (membrane-fusion protein)